MNTEERCAQIMRFIVSHCNDPKAIAQQDEGRRSGISFSPDHGECSMTVEISGIGHSHVGNWWETETPDSFGKLVDGLYDLLIQGKGLSFVDHGQAPGHPDTESSLVTSTSVDGKGILLAFSPATSETTEVEKLAPRRVKCWNCGTATRSDWPKCQYCQSPIEDTGDDAGSTFAPP